MFGDQEEHLLVNATDETDLLGVDADGNRKKYNRFDGFMLRTVNGSILSVQNLFIIHWIIYLLLAGFDQVFNLRCFYGIDDTSMIKADLEFIDIYSEGLADFVLWLSQIYMIVNGLVILVAFLFKIVLMFLKLPVNHKLIQLHLAIENCGFYLIYIYVTIYGALQLVVGQMDGLLLSGMLVSYCAIVQYFFFPAMRKFVYFFLSLYWAVFWLMNGLNAWNKIGEPREDQFKDWFARLCIGKGLALTALYAAKAAEFVVFILIMIALAVARHYLKLIVKLGTVIFLVYIVGDILLGNPDEAIEHSNYLFQLAITSVIYTVHPEKYGITIRAPYDEYNGKTIKPDYFYGKSYRFFGSSILACVRPSASNYYEEEASFYMNNVASKNKDPYSNQ